MDDVPAQVPLEGDQVALVQQGLVLLVAQAEACFALFQRPVHRPELVRLLELGEDAVEAGEIDDQAHDADQDVVEQRPEIVEGGDVGEQDEIPAQQVDHGVERLHHKQGGKGDQGDRAADLADREGAAEVKDGEQHLPQHKEAARRQQDAVAGLPAQAAAFQAVDDQKGRRPRQKGEVKAEVGPVVGGGQPRRGVEGHPDDIEQFDPHGKHRDDPGQDPVEADGSVDERGAQFRLDEVFHLRSPPLL